MALLLVTYDDSCDSGRCDTRGTSTLLKDKGCMYIVRNAAKVDTKGNGNDRHIQNAIASTLTT